MHNRKAVAGKSRRSPLHTFPPEDFACCLRHNSLDHLAGHGRLTVLRLCCGWMGLLLLAELMKLSFQVQPQGYSEALPCFAFEAFLLLRVNFCNQTLAEV